MQRLFLLLSSLFIGVTCNAQLVTNFEGFYQNGQVFFTWDIADTNASYKLYRYPSKIKKGEQLAACEYLGITNSKSSLNNNQTVVDSVKTYWVIEEGADPLSPDQGLFVTTTVENGDFFYALTSILNGEEDTTINVDVNSLKHPITEVIATPEPILQEIREIENKPVEIYGDFMSSRNTLNGPLRLGNAGWLGYVFGVYRNDQVTPQPLMLRFHAGGKDFLNGITSTKSTEVNLRFEDFFPDSTEHSSWIGTNENYNPYDTELGGTPETGINYFYTQERMMHELQWAFKNLPVDSTKVYVEGTSFGAYGAFFFAMAYPDKIAGVDVTVGMFDTGFQDDYNDSCTMNAGMKNRLDGQKKFGTVEDDLMSSTGYHTYDILNACWVINKWPEDDYPMMCSINGREDAALGWTEKTIWYDSLNVHKFGGMWFWDNREHNGNGKTWSYDNFDNFKYSTKTSFPAISNCSANDDYGNGHGDDGDIYGQINGFVDWQPGDIIDETKKWALKIYLRDLHINSNTFYYTPDSCTVDITPRRLQNFSPEIGDSLAWSISYEGDIEKSGSLLYQGGLITIPELTIHKDTVFFEIHVMSDTFYLDFDSDNYGDVFNYIVAPTPPLGYVANHDDCNDLNSNVNPDITETCNGIDDDCDLEIDDGFVLTTYYQDSDTDSYGNLNITLTSCSGAPLGYVSNYLDCNDAAGSINPAAAEICNGVDDNCVGGIDEGLPYTTYYLDEDGDNFGDNYNTVSTCDGAPTGYVTVSSDCDDGNFSRNPGALEVCNGIDDNCNITIDEGLPFVTYFQDLDHDNYGNALNSVSTCNGAPSEYVSDNTDCDDTNPLVYPGADEIQNTIDDDCDNVIDEYGVGINESGSNFSLSIFPNPASTNIIIDIELESKESAPAVISVFNVLGERVYELHSATSSGILHKEIPVDDKFANGTYLIRLTVGERYFVQSLLVHK